MEKQFGLPTEELEKIFAQMKSKGDNNLSDKIYKAYLPLIDKVVAKLNISTELVQDAYNDAFVCIYQNIMDGTIKASEFAVCFENLFVKTCFRSAQQASEQSESLSDRLIVREANRRQQEVQKENEYARQSLMFVAQTLTRFAQDEELMAQYGLTRLHIDIVKDYHGLNAEERAYTLAQLAEKYNVTESRAKAVLVKGLSILRKSNEFNAIKTNNFSV